MPAIVLERRIRAYDPWPGTFTVAIEGGKEKRLKIFPPSRVTSMELPPGVIAVDDDRLIVGCGKGALELEFVQPEGGRRMCAGEYLRGRKPQRFS
jgi:methionyl-tRNA formyltransferase